MFLKTEAALNNSSEKQFEWINFHDLLKYREIHEN